MHALIRFASHRLGSLVVACSLAAAALPLQAETAPWPESPFSYIGRDQQLDRILASFARTFGLQLRLETSLSDSLAAVTGRASANTPTEFLNQLSAANGLTWYYHAGVLYIGRASERVTRLLPTKGMSGAALKKAFAEMGILEPRFGWGDVDERSAVMVSGPRSYVERIARALADFPDPLAEQQVLVFRLKHAAVDDRTILYRDKQIVTPGVATMLRNLLGEGPGQSSGALATEVSAAGQPRNVLKPLVSDGPDPAAPPSAAPKNSKPADGSRPADRAVIQSDTRLNAIIIKDKPQNAPIYRELIEMLDVPSSLIEIEAAIVDVNTSSMADLGVDWNARKGNISGGFGTPAAAPDGTTLTLIRGANVNPSTIIAEAGNFLMTRIKVMEGKGSARIVSRPFILTQDNMGALIDLSDTFYIQTSGERVATVTPVSVGVTLRVTPRIVLVAGMRSIQLVVDIEDGSIQDTKVGTLPTVRRSVIGTQALVGENESLLIGGFNSEQNMRQKDQVPVLGDVPGVGVFFSKTVANVEKRERMFLITPRVVSSRMEEAAALANQLASPQPVKPPVQRLADTVGSLVEDSAVARGMSIERRLRSVETGAGGQ
ncbi:type III secretion system outer membrane ring subunit SctC [Caenimonas sp. SL110]|uniref:type III secretion system outer membrane ring subunit SctC n=1 Tax=Caenimonas sp. SL110 TaxID=1450524 RepID=UPI00069EEE0C|nr:type III secretion system outer membrane ring subunit SctC [Caenimonas sp. SL110]